MSELDLTLPGGQSLSHLLGATKQTLASGLTDKVLAHAVRSDSAELAAWAKTASWSGMPDVIASHLMGFLQQDALGIFIGAWSKSAELLRCASESQAHPADTSSVALTQHDFSYSMQPAIDVLLDGKRLGAIPFTIQLQCEVDGLELMLQAGELKAIRCGTCNLSAGIDCAGQAIWHYPAREINLPGEFRFTKPVRLAS